VSVRSVAQDRSDAEPAPARRKLGAALVGPVRPAACWVALVFFWASLYPTLLPRAWWAQGAVTGLSVDLGIVVGSLLAAAVTAALAALDRPVPRVIPRHGRRWFAATAAVVGIVGMVVWWRWQNDQRHLVTMSSMSAGVVVPVVVVAGVVGLVFFILGRLVAHPVRRFDGLLVRWMPRVGAHVLTAAIVVVVGVVITRQFVVQPLGRFANDRFAVFDTGTDEGVKPTQSSLRSGGPGSLVTWDSLGLQGRSFVAGGPSVAELQAFAPAGTTARDPIRVYVGSRAADSLTAQAQLAVKELERTGAFERSVLAIATVTGTGWINPVVADGLEYMYHGDTAIVATQYSYLPSWISFLVDLDAAADSGRTLVAAVRQHWSQLPADHRPRLVAFGESLGSYGSESAFEGRDAAASVAAVASQVQGALWIGPTFANPIWDQIVDARRPGSPVWDPVYGDGRQVVILGRAGRPPSDGQAEPHPSIVYLTHPSDPVTWASVDTLWSPPSWMDSPTGYDVPDGVLWFPAVTMIQSTFDLMEGFGAPPGFGHDYRPTIADGWVAVAAPTGWTTADTMRLRAQLLNS